MAASKKVLSTLKYVKYTSYLENTEAATRGVLQKDVIKTFQNSQENACTRISFLISLIKPKACKPKA